MELRVRSRGRIIWTLPTQASVRPDSTLASLYQHLAKISRYSAARLRITRSMNGNGVLPNSNDVLISEVGLQDGDSIFVKDLGPQISWRTVYLFEYIGPFIIHLTYYIYLFNYHRAQYRPSLTQALLFFLIMLHYIKREYETIYIHQFSNATIPLANLVKNSVHSWVGGGILLSTAIYSPASLSARPLNLPTLYLGLLLWLIGESGNLKTHLILHDLRQSGTTERKLPTGWGFDLITCPNYSFETLSWVGILVMSRSWAVVVFLAFGVAQMGIWARKEVKYGEVFRGVEGYSKKKWVMIPWVW